MPHLPSVLERIPAGIDTVGVGGVVVEVVVTLVVVEVVVVLLLVIGGWPAVVVVVMLGAGPPGMPGTPKHAPKSLRQPAPQ